MHIFCFLLFIYCSVTFIYGKTLNSETNDSNTDLQIAGYVNTTCKSSYECAGKLLCYSGLCQCSIDMFWNETHCLMKKGNLRVCNTAEECQDSLVCTDNKCQCVISEYWNGVRCTKRKTFNTKCKSSRECLSTLYCARQICQCASTDYWSGVSCQLRKSVNISCLTTNECGDSLQCTDKICQCCISDYWNGDKCVKKRSVNAQCETQNQCESRLLCNNNFCVCPENEYWKDGNCFIKKSFQFSCITTDQCQKSLHCIGSTCQCNNKEYWTNSACTSEKDYGEVCSSTRECQDNLECKNYRCVCIARFYWDGIICSEKLYKECADVQADEDGVYAIQLDQKIYAFCIMRSSEKWTVIQRRQDGSVDFYRPWLQYKAGFGEIKGEFWLGNDNIHMITASGNHKLSVYIEDWDGTFWYANYSTFSIGDASSEYRLNVSGYSGDGGDSLKTHNDQMFSTFDRDNDSSSQNCAEKYLGAWWYQKCHHSNLNGKYNGTSAKGVSWYRAENNHKSRKKTLMMITRR